MPCTKSPKRFQNETCHGESNSLASHMKVVPLVEFLFCKIQPSIVELCTLQTILFPLKIKIKLFTTTQWSQNENQTAYAGR